MLTVVLSGGTWFYTVSERGFPLLSTVAQWGTVVGRPMQVLDVKNIVMKPTSMVMVLDLGFEPTAPNG